MLFSAFLGGFLLIYASSPSRHSRMLPWIVGRGLGLAGYLALTALVLLGTWFSHPWRFRRSILHPAVQLRVHAVLAAGTLVLVAGHVLAMVVDRYAHVGFTGALVPGTSGYRPTAVALGTVALYLGLAAGASAALAGRFLIRHRWLAVHRFAAAVFALAWFHGVLAGSDTPALRAVYALTGLAVLFLTATRLTARAPEARGGPPGDVVPVAPARPGASS
ncbi:MAG TPA: hypothetical protein VNC61_14830 [Acidimicrobiales bacterium]|nr:hypothetical protein [Acidimicrobiales bacterium]